MGYTRRVSEDFPQRWNYTDEQIRERLYAAEREIEDLEAAGCDMTGPMALHWFDVRAAWFDLFKGQIF